MGKRSIDINCDMGESSPLRPGYSPDQDIALMDHVSSINLACGFHAGDAETMHLLAEAALVRGIAIGAHPSFPDRENFGRKKMNWQPAWLYDQIIYQLGALEAFLKIRGARLLHVKPHGALYNMAAADFTIAKIVAKAVADYDSRLIVMGLSGSQLISAAKEQGLLFAQEAFADRTYQSDGFLTSREKSDALLPTAEASVNQVLTLCKEQRVWTTDKTSIPLEVDTICIHSDGSTARTIASQISAALRNEGISINAASLLR